MSAVRRYRIEMTDEEIQLAAASLMRSASDWTLRARRRLDAGKERAHVTQALERSEQFRDIARALLLQRQTNTTHDGVST